MASRSCWCRHIGSDDLLRGGRKGCTSRSNCVIGPRRGCSAAILGGAGEWAARGMRVVPSPPQRVPRGPLAPRGLSLWFPMDVPRATPMAPSWKGFHGSLVSKGDVTSQNSPVPKDPRVPLCTPHRIPVILSAPKCAHGPQRSPWSHHPPDALHGSAPKGPRGPVHPPKCLRGPITHPSPHSSFVFRGSLWSCHPQNTPVDSASPKVHPQMVLSSTRRSPWSHHPPEGPHGPLTHWSPQGSVTPKRFPWTRHS